MANIDIEWYDGTDWVAVAPIRDWEVEIGTSDVQVAPQASVVTDVDMSVDANAPLRIRADGSTFFEGLTNSAGELKGDGRRIIEVRGNGTELMEASVNINLTGPTTEEVLQAALNDVPGGGGYTLQYNPSPLTMTQPYETEDRPLKNVFRDVADFAEVVWTIRHDKTIIVDVLGNGGTFGSVDIGTSAAELREWDAGKVDTVRNRVVVNGTFAERVIEVASDSDSIDEYGERTLKLNVFFAVDGTAAQTHANALLIPDPIPEGEVVVTDAVGDIHSHIANESVTIDYDRFGISNETVPIELAVITDDGARLEVGAGAGVQVDSVNRNTESKKAVTTPGSVYDSERIADGSIDSNKLVDAAVIEKKLADAAVTSGKLVDTAVTEEKLADLAVATDKLKDNAVIQGKLADLSVSETKIQDDSISTPKLQAEAVTASEIEADTITAAEIAAGTITALEVATDTLTAEEIAAGTITALEVATDTLTANEIAANTITAGEITSGTITALEIASNTLTANEIDVLELDAGELSVSGADKTVSFTVEDILGTDHLSIEPTGSGSASIGTESNPFDFAGLNTIRPGSAGSGTLGTSGAPYGSANINEPTFANDLTVSCFIAQGEADGQPTFKPTSDDAGYIGDFDESWSAVRANNFTETSQPSFEGDACDGLCDADYGSKRLPDFALENVEGAGKTGINLGRMASYLLSVCQEQEERIQDIEDLLAATRSD